jgi:hypothetical protein
MTIDTLETVKAELAEAESLLREAFPKGIGLKVSDAAVYAPELCGWVHRSGGWPRIEKVRAYFAQLKQPPPWWRCDE